MLAMAVGLETLAGTDDPMRPDVQDVLDTWQRLGWDTAGSESGSHCRRLFLLLDQQRLAAFAGVREGLDVVDFDGFPL